MLIEGKGVNPFMNTARTQTPQPITESVLDGMKPSITPYTRHLSKCNHQDRNYHRCGCPIWFFNPAMPRGKQRYSADTNDWNDARKKASGEPKVSHTITPRHRRRGCPSLPGQAQQEIERPR